jgi:probable F420-dependent oxidoreductase
MGGQDVDRGMTGGGWPPAPFRFIAPMPRMDGALAAWRDGIRRIEDLGFSTVSISDHLTKGWTMDPFVALAAAAENSRTLRLLTLVLSNDFRHPAVVHKAVTNLDVLSGGRVELGLGAGWRQDDYDAAGLEFEAAGVRLERLEESISVLKRLWTEPVVDLEGRFYRISGLEGLPRPVQLPHPPVLIGGGGPRALRLAAREATIVGVHARLSEGALGPAAAEDLSAARIEEKVGWVRDAWQAAGRPPGSLELQFSAYLVRVTDSSRQREAARSSFSGLLEADPKLLRDSPAVLVGSHEACIEALIERRERFGLSYWSLGSDLEAVAPIVARLTGT